MTFGGKPHIGHYIKSLIEMNVWRVF